MIQTQPSIKTDRSLEHKELTGKIIAAAITVHKTLGPGFLESVYENALMVELEKQGLQAARQIDLPVLYGGVEVGRHRLDIMVEDLIVVELKAIKEFEEIHYAILKSYLRASGKKTGLLMNFSKVTLDVKRVFSK